MKSNLPITKKIQLTSKQAEELEVLSNLCDHIYKANNKQLASTFAQFFLETLVNKPHIIFCVLPPYKAKQILNIINQQPSGKIKRRDFLKDFKIHAKNQNKKKTKSRNQNKEKNKKKKKQSKISVFTD